jgi:hypothetical protein
MMAAVGPSYALQVFAAANGAPTSWGALPAGSRAVQVAWADPATLAVRAAASGVQTAYRTTATGATLIASPIVDMELSRNSSSTQGTARFMFVNTSLSGGIGDVVAYDLTATAPSPIQVASAAHVSSIGISYDQTYVRVLENFDATAMTGTLTAVALPSGTATALAPGVGLGSPTFAGNHTLFYLDSSTGDRTLTAWDERGATSYASGVQQYRVRFSPSTVYFSTDPAAAPPDWAPGVYATAMH